MITVDGLPAIRDTDKEKEERQQSQSYQQSIGGQQQMKLISSCGHRNQQRQRTLQCNETQSVVEY